MNNLKRMILVAIGGALGGIPLAILSRSVTPIVSTCFMTSLIGFSYALGTEVTKGKRLLIRAVVRNIICIVVLCLILLSFVSLGTMFDMIFSSLFRKSVIESENFLSVLIGSIYLMGYNFIFFCFGISIADDLLRRYVLLRILGMTIFGGLFYLGGMYLINILVFENPYVYQWYLQIIFGGGSIALGIAIGSVTSELIDKKANSLVSKEE